MSAIELQDKKGDAGQTDAYDHDAVEARWQAAWTAAGVEATPAPDERQSASVIAACPLAAGSIGLDHVRSCAIADVYARFRRAKGDAVLFALGFHCVARGGEREAPGGEREAPEQGGDLQAWAEERRDGMRDQLERLGCSCDWDRAFLSTDPAQVGWSQRLFLALLEQDLIYRRGARWLLRTSAYAEASSRGLDALSHWSEDAIDAQRETLGEVDGVEVDAVILGGGTLPVFTPHPDSIESAAFIAVSPAHPEIDALTAQPDVAARLEQAREADWWREDKDTKRVPAVATGLQASVPGASTLLPLVISPRVDDSFGATAVLGIPECDEGDRAISEALEKPAAGAWKLTKVSAKPRAGVRYRMEDVVVAAPGSSGAPAPLIRCERCDAVPAPLEQLPLQYEAGATDAAECDCPRCGGRAQRDGAAIEPRFDRMWMWLSACAAVDERPSAGLGPERSAGLGHPEAQRWLPVGQFVGEPGADRLLLERRAIAKMLEDIGELPPVEAREPFARAILPGRVRGQDGESSDELGDVLDPGELIGRVGADVVRLAVLNAAAPQRSFAWNDQPVRHGRRLLSELRAYAEPRLREWPAPADGIDGSTRWRRRLVKWCRVAADKVATGIDRLEMQRASHNALLLFTRIKDFESRVAGEDGELETADREAVAGALLVLLQVLAPFVPHVSEELWATAGHDSLLAETSWPG